MALGFPLIATSFLRNDYIVGSNLHSYSVTRIDIRIQKLTKLQNQNIRKLAKMSKVTTTIFMFLGPVMLEVKNIAYDKNFLSWTKILSTAKKFI